MPEAMGAASLAFPSTRPAASVTAAAAASVGPANAGLMHTAGLAHTAGLPAAAVPPTLLRSPLRGIAAGGGLVTFLMNRSGVSEPTLAPETAGGSDAFGATAAFVLVLQPVPPALPGAHAATPGLLRRAPTLCCLAPSPKEKAPPSLPLLEPCCLDALGGAGAPLSRRSLGVRSHAFRPWLACEPALGGPCCWCCLPAEPPWCAPAESPTYMGLENAGEQSRGAPFPLGGMVGAMTNR